MDIGTQAVRRDVRRHIRSPSEIGRKGWIVLRSAMMEKPHATDIIDKKTVIAMIGLPVLFISRFLSTYRRLERVIYPRCFEDI